MDRVYRKRLTEAVYKAIAEKEKAGVFNTVEAALNAVQELAESRTEWTEIRRQAVMDLVYRKVRNAMGRSIEKSFNNEPYQLPFDGFEGMPQFIEIDGDNWINQQSATLKELDAALARRKAKAEGYQRPRQSDARKEKEAQRTATMEAFRAEMAVYFARGAKTISDAIEMHRKHLKKPMVKQRQQAIRKRWEKAKSGPTKNE